MGSGRLLWCCRSWRSQPSFLITDQLFILFVCRRFLMWMARQMERHIRCNNVLTDNNKAQRQLCWRWQRTFGWAWRMDRWQVLLLLNLFTGIWYGGAAKCPELFGWCWYAGGVISRWTSTVCEIWWSRIFCWGCDVWFLKDLFLFRSCYISYIDDVSRVIRYCRFHIYVDLQIYHTCAVSNFQRWIDELIFDLQRVHEWAASNGLKLNPIKSQVIMISRCRVDIPPPTLLIGSDVMKVVSKVNNLGYVLNEELTATDHFKKVCQKVYWILHSLRPHASYTPFEVTRRLVVSLKKIL
jgi:hypothetical protein